jgi:transcriptional regulator with XRE-family HTH domain
MALPENSRRELAHILRARRERLQPDAVGLPNGGRRRTRGLRREEVALLAGVSSTYYAFLEQARDVQPSREVLDALARALRMDSAERAYLHVLAHGSPPRERDRLTEALSPGVAALVGRLDPHPTYVKGRRWDILAANRAARALFTDWEAREPGDRNLIWWVFTDPRARAVYVEWEKEAARLLARFRGAAARHPDEPGFAELIDRLNAVSPEWRRWWPDHEVLPLSSGSKRLRHPALGELTFQHVVLQPADRPDQSLVTFSCPEAEDRLAALAAEVTA